MKILTDFRKVLLLLCVVTAGACSDDENKLDYLTGFLSFGFSDESLADYEFTIGDQDVITNEIPLPFGFDASSLTPEFSPAPFAVAYIGEEEQESGSKSMDFTEDVIYTVISGNGQHQRIYTVRVNVATEISNWTNLSPNAKFPDYTSIAAFEIDGKYFIVGGKQGAAIYGDHVYGIYASTDGSSFSKVDTTIFQTYGIGLGAAAVKHEGKQLLIGGYTPSDYFGGGTGDGYGINKVWASTDGVTWEKQTETDTTHTGWGPAPEINSFSARTNVSVANLNGDLYLTGGYSIGFGTPQGALGDVWKSTDGGATWSNLNADFGADFLARADGKLMVYNNELHLIGGKTAYPTTYFNEIYKSPDGVNWTKLEVKNPFPKRAGFSCFVCNDRIFVIGGLGNKEITQGETTSTEDVLYEDMWVSDDGGITWTDMSETLPAGFGKRHGQASTINGNTVHIFGGTGLDTEGNSQTLTDAWKGSLH